MQQDISFGIPKFEKYTLRQKMAIQLAANEKIIKKAEKTIAEGPDGRLRICQSKNRVQYYQCMNAVGDKYGNGKYISKKKLDLAAQLAQKDYCLDLVEQLREECSVLKAFLAEWPEPKYEEADKIRENMCAARAELIKPYLLTDDEYGELWRSSIYPKEKSRQIPTSYTTNQGEFVRSKTEKIIADELYRQNIPYRYEFPIRMQRGYDIHPDFTVLNKKTRKTYFWEHCGMMSQEDYVSKLSDRLNEYAENGLFVGEDIILTFESETKPLTTRMIKLQIEHYLQ